MDMLVVSSGFVLIITVLAYRAGTRFHSEARLPMQWGLNGAVNWSAPRRLALAFMPILAAGLLGFVTILSLTVPPRAGQERLVFPILVGMGVALVALQQLHFWAIAHALRRNAG